MSYFDDTDDSEALRLWQERLEAYLGGQAGVEGLRSRVQPNPPWPDSDKPMLGYLLARAMEVHESGGLEMALTWVAAHAWFGSAVDTRASLIRHLGACVVDRRLTAADRAVATRPSGSASSSPRTRG